MKNSIYIITHFYKSVNYGGMLQSYALPKAINAMGFRAKQIKYKFSRSNILQLIVKKYNQQGFYRLVNIVIKHIYYKTSTLFLKDFIDKNNNTFAEFQSNYVASTNKEYTRENVHELSKKGAVFICGSDQIWNLNLSTDATYFLDFVPKNKKKISYAASISMDSLSTQQKEFFSEKLSSFHAISVRERKAKDLIYESTDKEITVVLDPTLLLTENDWNQIASDRIVKEKYIFSYLLGNNNKHRKIISNLSKEIELPVVTIPYINNKFQFYDIFFGDKKLYDVGPREFVSLIKHAEYVFTDSFHACIFSVIYHKQFYVFKRFKDTSNQSMNSRIYDLMNLLNTQEQIIDDNDIVSKINLNKKVNYNMVDKIIKEEKKKSLEFLKQALS